MGYQISKYPLTPGQLREHKLPDPPKMVPVTFRKCQHKTMMFDGLAKERGGFAELDEYCFACEKIKRSR
jgi:hypothetical protein